MKAPGEDLIIAMWKTLTEKGIGNLLRPLQIRREGRAQAMMKYEEKLLIAQAEKETLEIMSGKKFLRIIDDQPHLVSSNVEPQIARLSAPEPELSLEPAYAAIHGALHADTLRREINVARAIQQAEEDLLDATNPVPEKVPGADWLYRWRDYAGEVSSEELQSIWGRLLAGEVKNPGSYSLRTLEFLRNASMEEAQLVGKIAPFVTAYMVYKDDDLLEKYGVSFGDFMRLEEIGLLSGTSGTLAMHFGSIHKDKFLCYMDGRDWGLEFHGKIPEKRMVVPAYLLSKLGTEVFGIAEARTNVDFLRETWTMLKDDDLEAYLCKMNPVDNSDFDVISREKLD